MTRPLSYEIITTEDGQYLVNSDLDLYIYLSSDINLSEELLENIVFIYEEYGLEDDDNLTSDGIELKNTIREYFVEG